MSEQTTKWTNTKGGGMDWEQRAQQCPICLIREKLSSRQPKADSRDQEREGLQLWELFVQSDTENELSA